MKRFDFPLERVRRWRGGQATLEEMKLERLFAELSVLAEQRRQILAERAEAESILNAQTPLSADDLARLDSFRHYVRARCNALGQLQREQESKIAKQRERVVEAKRQFELLDRLRKKTLLEWRTAHDKEQEALAAELFLAKRKRPSSLQ